MQYSTSKIVKTRKSHQCVCGKMIPAKTECMWYKAVSFRDTETGNQWHEGWICPECLKEAES